MDTSTTDGPLLTLPSRHEAPGGWRRAVVGVTLGVGFGLVLLRLLPRDQRRGGH